MRFALFILALAVRLAAIEHEGWMSVKFGDAYDYNQAADTICRGAAYPERSGLPVMRPPGLPFFIAGVTACDSSLRPWLVKLALAACDGVTVLLIVLIAARLGMSRGAQWIAGAGAAFHPWFAGAVTDIRTEPLFMMLLTLAIWLLLRGNHAWAGAAAALAALTRPTGLLCILLFAVYARRRAPVLLAAAALVLAPWTVRNALRYHELIVVSDGAGYNMWRASHPDMLALMDERDPAKFRDGMVGFEVRTQFRASVGVLETMRTPRARDREWRRMAWENMRRDPALAARAAVKRIAGWWRPWLHRAEYGANWVALSAVVNITLFALGFIGLWRFPDRRLALAVAIFFGVMWLAHAPYIPTMRLRVPLTDPLLIVFASYAIVTLPRALLLFVPIVAGAIAATQIIRVPAAQQAIAVLQEAGDAWWAVPLFAALYVLCTLFLLPVGVLSAAAAVTWGWQVGGALELAACTLAALPPFALARRGLASWIERRLPREGVPALDSPFLLFLLRLVPVVPYVALNYLAGATRVRLRDYVVATFAGSIPSVFLFAYFVDGMAAGAMGLATQARLLGVCAVIAIAAIIVRLVAPRLARRS